MKLVPYALYPTLEAAVADGWPSAQYGYYATGPNETSWKWCWCALSSD